MLDYAASDTCLSGRLLRYFGETLTACGHCGICLGDPPARVAKTPARQSGVRVPVGFEALVDTFPDALARPRQQARFLCGLSSPAVSAIRELRGHRLFGALAAAPFADVHAARDQRAE